MKKIGMIGIGLMGHGIAKNIIDRGIPLILYDIRPQAYADLLQLGAEAADDLQAMGKKADTVIVIVNSAANCKSVFDGLLKTMRGGTIIIMSTIGMTAAKELETLAAAAGCRMMDCPVSGGTSAAGDGTLTIIASGAGDLFEENKPLFESFGKKIFHVGTEVGQGQAVKIVNQMLVGIHICAAAEAFNMARQCGLDLETVYDVVSNSAGSSRIFENRGKYFIERNFDSRSTLQIQLKDTNIAMDTAAAVGAPTVLCAAARELFQMAEEKYTNTDDPIEVIRLYEEAADLDGTRGRSLFIKNMEE